MLSREGIHKILSAQIAQIFLTVHLRSNGSDCTIIVYKEPKPYLLPSLPRPFPPTAGCTRSAPPSPDPAPCSSTPPLPHATCSTHLTADSRPCAAAGAWPWWAGRLVIQPPRTQIRPQQRCGMDWRPWATGVRHGARRPAASPPPTPPPAPSPIQQREGRLRLAAFQLVPHPKSPSLSTRTRHV